MVRTLLLKDLSSISILLINIILCAIWYLIVFILCISVKSSTFDYNRNCYQPKKWEKCGKMYEKVFKIKKWKDFIPQYIGKNGFSKRHWKSLSLGYVNEFIFETCRAEWNHKHCCFYSLVAIIINPLLYGLVFSVSTFAFNLACIMIQRYNRIRILKLKIKLTKIGTSA